MSKLYVGIFEHYFVAVDEDDSEQETEQETESDEQEDTSEPGEQYGRFVLVVRADSVAEASDKFVEYLSEHEDDPDDPITGVVYESTIIELPDGIDIPKPLRFDHCYRAVGAGLDDDFFLSPFPDADSADPLIQAFTDDDSGEGEAGRTAFWASEDYVPDDDSEAQISSRPSRSPKTCRTPTKGTDRTGRRGPRARTTPRPVARTCTESQGGEDANQLSAVHRARSRWRRPLPARHLSL